MPAEDLHPDQVQAAVRSLLAVAAAWLDAKQRGQSSDANTADADLLGNISRLLAEHEAELPLFRAGRHVVRRRDPIVLSVIERVIPVLRSVQKGATTPHAAAAAIAAVVRPIATTDITPEAVLAKAKPKVAPTDGSGMKDWIQGLRGPVDAATQLVQGLAERGRARRLLLKKLDNEPLPENEQDDRLLGLVLEARARGRVLGQSALVRTALTALGFHPEAVKAALHALLEVHRREQTRLDAPDNAEPVIRQASANNNAKSLSTKPSRSRGKQTSRGKRRTKVPRGTQR